MEIVLIILILAVIVFLVLFFNTNKKEVRSSALKKEELIQKYEEEMRAVLDEYKENPELQKIKKIEYLKKASAKIHNNIFFSDGEARTLVQRLASL